MTSRRSMSWTASLEPGSEAFAGYTMWLGSDGAGTGSVFSAILYGLAHIADPWVWPPVFIALVIGTAIGLDRGLCRRPGREP